MMVVKTLWVCFFVPGETVERFLVRDFDYRSPSFAHHCILIPKPRFAHSHHLRALPWNSGVLGSFAASLLLDYSATMEGSLMGTALACYHLCCLQ
jgi:hypothetical protein